MITHLPLHPYDACTNIIQTHTLATNKSQYTIVTSLAIPYKNTRGASGHHVLPSTYNCLPRPQPRHCTTIQQSKKKNREYIPSYHTTRGTLQQQLKYLKYGLTNPFTQSSKSLYIQDYTSNLTQKYLACGHPPADDSSTKGRGGAHTVSSQHLASSITQQPIRH